MGILTLLLQKTITVYQHLLRKLKKTKLKFKSFPLLLAALLLLFCISLPGCRFFDFGKKEKVLTEKEQKVKTVERILGFLKNKNEKEIFGAYENQKYLSLKKEGWDKKFDKAYFCRKIGVCTEIFITSILDSRKDRIEHTLYRFSREFRKGNINEREALKHDALIVLESYIKENSLKEFKSNFRYAQKKTA